MRIGELSKMFGGVDRRTIDFYTNKGLLAGRIGENAKYRDYDQSDVERLGKILIFREMGLSINEIETALNDSTYWSPQRLDQHIAMLKQNQARENERYEQMIRFVEVMKEAGMAPLRFYKPTEIPIERYVKYWVKAFQNINRAWEDGAGEDIAQFDDMLSAFISHMERQMDQGYDSIATQNIVERLASRLMNSIGTILYMSFNQLVASDAIFSLFEQDFKDDDSLDEDDIVEFKALMNDMFSLIAEWCRVAKSHRNICDLEAMQSHLEESLQKLREKYDDDGSFFNCTALMEIVGSFMNDLTEGQALETFILPALFSANAELDEKCPGLERFINKAIEYFVDRSGHK
ncbi:MAG: MerR family transcriptional regulator [Clostridia bacterium]|nr:MerR family transcriptional regulator [Clostridia bacterium]